MTQQQFLREFKSYPKAQKSIVISQLLRILADDLEEIPSSNGNEFSVEERKTAYLRLRGALKMENPPITKEEVREDYYNYLTEKYK